jgi:tetratricopeptide (TPR) repeat protein
MEVELFDDKGSATGGRFLVQIKATDEPNVTKALKLQLPHEKANYYRSLDLPVLIVRYHSPARTLYVRWFHSFDPYYGKRSEKQIVFKFESGDAWTDSTIKKLTIDLEAFRQVRSPQLSAPLRFSLRIVGEQIHGIPPGTLRERLHNAFRRVRRIISLEETAQPVASSHRIGVDASKIEVLIAGANGFTLHTPDGYVGGDASLTLVADVMISVGLALDWHGHPLEGAAIVEAFWSEARLPREPKVAFAVARCLARANRTHIALGIAEELFSKASTIEAANVYLLPFLARPSGETPADENFLLLALFAITKMARERGDNISAAVFSYNRGSRLRGLNRMREALGDYHSALDLDNGYATRPYFWRELGGIFFQARRFKASVTCYEKSLALQADRPTQALLADALLFAGRYSEAEAKFSEYKPSIGMEAEWEWMLKQSTVSYIRLQTGLDVQKRRSECVSSAPSGQWSDEQIDADCRRILACDALSGLAWFNLGGVYHRRGDLNNATRCFLAAALVQPADVEAWANAFGLLMKVANQDLLLPVLMVAFRYNQDNFLEHLASRFPGAEGKFLADFSELVRAMNDHEDDGVLFRLHRSPTSWDEFRTKE